MNEHERQMLELCERFLSAVVAADLDAVRALYAPDARIWHNTDGTEQTVDENLRTLALATKAIAGFRYEDARRRATSDGFIEQHVVRGRAPDGTELRVPAVIICTVAEGRITRLDEYLDSAHIEPLLRRGS